MKELSTWKKRTFETIEK